MVKNKLSIWFEHYEVRKIFLEIFFIFVFIDFLDDMDMVLDALRKTELTKIKTG